MGEREGGLQEFQQFPDDLLVVIEDVVSAVDLEPLPIVVAGVGELQRHQKGVKEEREHALVHIFPDVSLFLCPFQETGIGLIGDAFDLVGIVADVLLIGHLRDLVVEFHIAGVLPGGLLDGPDELLRPDKDLVVGLKDLFDDGVEFTDRFFQTQDEQVLFGFKILIHEADGNAGLLGDDVDVRVLEPES